MPDRKMTTGARNRTLLDEIAVGEQHRRFFDIGLDACGVDRHHVRPVGEIGDAAKALRLTLGAKGCP